METSYQKFIKWFCEFYTHEFPMLSKDWKDEVIQEVLTHNNKYITKEEVINFDACNKCGRCCRNQRCPDFDSETNLCTRHDNPIADVCREYPWSGDLGIMPLYLDCHYQVSFFVNYFDNFFKKAVEELDDHAS